MLRKNQARLRAELNRINRVIDHAEDTKIAESFIEVRKAVFGLVEFVDSLIGEEVAEQLAGVFIIDVFPEPKTVPTSE